MDCAFCNILKDANNESLICKMKHGSLYVNFNQYYHGRVMYVYNQHIQDVAAIDLDSFFSVDKEIIVITKAIKEIFEPELMNVASLGNHVQHLHWHIIPRYKNEETWGNPPWPHERKNLNIDEVKKLAAEIRNKLKQNDNFKALGIFCEGE